MIREELVSTIGQSATDFESYMADRQNSGHITDSAAGMRQVGGTFRLLEYPGAALLANMKVCRHCMINMKADLEYTFHLQGLHLLTSQLHWEL